MSWMRRKALMEQRADVQKEMKQILDLSDKEQRDLTSEESGQFDELSKRSDNLTTEIARFDRMIEIESESRADQPGREDASGKPEEQRRQEEDPEQLEKRHKAAFDAFLRGGQTALNEEQRSLIAASGDERRALSVSGFGVVGVRPFYGRLVEAQKLYSGVREAGAEVMATANGNQMPIATSDDTGNVGQILGEGAQETNTDTGATAGNVMLDGYKYSSKFIRLSLELIQDADFDVEGYIVRTAGERIGRAFNVHATTGDGSSKPRGFVTAAVAASQIQEAADNAALAYDDLLDLMNKVDASYWRAPMAGFQMSQTTLTGARKLKDDNGMPIWTPAMSDRGERIHGYKVTLNNDLANFGGSTNDVVAAFGDWSQYKIRDVTRPVVLRLAEKFAEFGQVGFIVLSRHDGDLANSKAIAVLDLPAAG